LTPALSFTGFPLAAARLKVCTLNVVPVARIRARTGLVSILSCLVLFLAGAIRAAEPPRMKRVLLLHQEGLNGPLFRARFDAAFAQALRSDEAVPIDLYEESIDSQRFAGARQSRLFRNYLKDKYTGRPIDVIVVVGSRALHFARQNLEIFGNPPIVAAVSSSGLIDPGSGITGLQGGLWINGTIDLALALRPDTRNVFVVDGSLDNNREIEGEVRRQVAQRPAALNLVYLRDLPLGELVTEVAAIPEHSVVLFFRQTLGDRAQALDPLEGLTQVVRASPVPVFGYMEELLGEGLVGGYMWRFETDARRMAEMARQILRGAKPQDVPPGRSTYATLLDERQLRQWGIPENRLPVESLVLFREASVPELHRAYVAGALFIIVAQVMLIAGFLMQSIRRRGAEARTLASEERYRNVVETQSELICRFLPDTTLTFVNDAYCRFWNMRRDELLGTKFIELIPPTARANVLERLGRLGSGTDSHEHPVTLSDGTVGWHHWVNHAILDERGGVAELQGVGRDITDRKRAEDALSRVEARNTAMLRAIPDLMFVLRRDGTFVDYHVRDQRLLFVPPRTFLGKTIRDVMPPELADRFMDALEQAVTHGGPVVVEYELQLEEPRYFEARLVSAGIDSVLSIVRDVTDSKRVIELNHHLAGRLIASQEVERQRVARDLHDDLSQKVALLNIEIDQIASQLEPGEPRSSLQRTSARAGEIATDIHNLSHELHPSKLRALGLGSAIHSLCREVTERRGIHVAFTHDALCEPADANISLCVYRVTQEALHNVARHSQAREASVRLTISKSHVGLTIADSGVGFDARNGRQQGLGLVSMRERVSFLKGELTIHTSPGKGTRVAVRIPLVQAARAGSMRVSKSA
jgi:PAS domain S-box-containing protein